MKWDFDNKTQESKGHGNCKTFHVFEIAQWVELTSGYIFNPGNQHIKRHRLNSSHGTCEDNFPIWGFKVQMALLMRPGNVILELRHLLLPENAWKIFYPKEKVSHIGSQHGLDGSWWPGKYLILPDLVASCCIFWQGCCKIYSVRQAWLNVSINEDLLDTILFCRTNACATSSFSKPIFTKTTPQRTLCGSIRWIKNIHPTKHYKREKLKNSRKPHYHPTSLVFKTTAPKSAIRGTQCIVNNWTEWNSLSIHLAFGLSDIDVWAMEQKIKLVPLFLLQLHICNS